MTNSDTNNNFIPKSTTFYKGGVKENLKQFKVLNYWVKHNEDPNNTIEPGETSKAIVWEYEGSPVDIVEVKPGCGCTSSVEYVGKTLKAYYTDTAVGINGNNLTLSDKMTGYKDITKSLTIYLDDGAKLKTKQGLQFIYNKNKSHVKIQFTVRVNLANLFPYMEPTSKKKGV